MDYRSIFRHYWKFLKRYKGAQVILLLGFGLGSLISESLIPLIYKNIVDDVSLASPNLERIYSWLILLAAAIIVVNICHRVGDYFIIKSQSKILKDLTDYSMDNLQRHSYIFFSNAFTGGLVAKTKRFVQAFETLHDQLVFQVWISIIGLTASFIILWIQSPILGLIFLIWTILYLILSAFLVKWQTPTNLANAEADSNATAHYSDIISNILTVKTFGFGRREKENFSKTTADQEKKRTAAWMRTGFWNNTFQGAALALFEIAIMFTSIFLWEQGIISVGTIVLVQIYSLVIFNLVWHISKNFSKAAAALSDANEMVKIFDEELEVKDPENPRKLNLTSGKIEFKNVSFSYEKSNKIFSGLNLTINSGEKVALVGHSGAGKSTIVKLLLRFMDVESGTILIDGQDISKATQDDLRSQIAYVPQEPLLFHRSLRENIAYAEPESAMEEIIEVAKRAHAHEFIENLPNQYESLVGERGIKLSGGERQRIAIARAMLKNAPIVILDEATSSLDSISEAKIQEAFEELMEGKTTIVIAHRLSTIRKMDRIIVFEGGEIVESGKHSNLINKQGVYSKLWESQVGGFIAE